MSNSFTGKADSAEYALQFCLSFNVVTLERFCDGHLVNVYSYKNAADKVEEKYIEIWNWKEQKHTSVAQFTG